MDIPTFFPLVSALFAIALGLIIFLHGKKNRVNFTFFLFILAVSVWFVGTFMMFISRPDIEAIIFWDKFVYVGVAFIPAIMFHFGLALTGNVNRFWNGLMRIGYGFSGLFLILIAKGMVIDGAHIYGWGAHTIALPLHTAFLAFFVTYLSLWFYLVYTRYRATSSLREQRQFRLILAGFAVLAIFGSLGFLPAYGISVYPVSYISGLIFTLILAYTILKLQLFNIRVVTAELFVFVIWVLLLVQAIFVDTFEMQVLAWGVFALIVPLGVYLVRSVGKEVQQREHIEKIAKDLEVANTRLKELDQMKSEFLSIASHQLRAPITAIKGYISLIREGDYGKVPKTMEEPLSNVFESVRVMVSSIDDYLNVSRIEQNRMKYEISDVDIAELTTKVVAELKPLAQARKLTLSVAAPASATVRADIGKIKQIITNLVDNAIKYTKEGKIAVTVEETADKVRVTIADTGVGLSQEDITGLFQKFKRAAGANAVNTVGTGLGLYVVRLLVEGHGGKVWAESEGVGEGSRFIVELPRIAKTSVSSPTSSK